MQTKIIGKAVIFLFSCLLVLCPISLVRAQTLPAADTTSPTTEPDATTQTATTTEPVAEPADTTSPVISEVAAVSLGLNEATIAWATDEPATSRLRYGTTSALGSEMDFGSAVLVHSALLTGLSTDTVYHYCIDATDAAGNTTESCGHTFTTEPEPIIVDTMPPVISEVAVTDITADGATISWKTDEVGSGYVEYGATADYGNQTSFDSSLTLDHSTALAGLSPDTEYHYRIVSTDEAGNEITSPDNTFTTEPLPSSEPVAETSATTSPAEATTTGSEATTSAESLMFYAITPEDILKTAVTIYWETSVPADSLIEYGVTPDLGQLSDHSAALMTTHEMAISGLTPDTLYYFRAVSKPSGATTAAMSELHEFTTLAEPIIVDPAADIIGVTTSAVTEASATISWSTNEPTVGTVEYGASTAYGKMAPLATSSTSHILNLSGLAPGTSYHFRVKAVDAGGNETYSLDQTFTTLAASASGSENSEIGTATSTQNTAPAGQETASTTAAENTASTGAGISAAPTSTPNIPVASGGGTVNVVPPGIPLLLAAAPVDSQIVFMWNNPETPGFSAVKIIRKEGGYPTSPSDGEVIYRGSGETFTDANLTNNHDYYYAMYSYNSYGQYSTPLHISLAPQQGIEEVKVEKVPILKDILPIEHFSGNLAFGDRGEEIVHLQQILNIEDVHASGLTTGYFGPLTQESLIKFQAKYNLPQTGNVDAATREKLTAISQSHIVVGAPVAVAMLSSNLARGDSGESVGYLQEFMAYEGSYPEALITQYFGPLTEQAVIAFQKKYGITPAVGYVGDKTRHAIQTAIGL